MLFVLFCVSVFVNEVGFLGGGDDGVFFVILFNLCSFFGCSCICVNILFVFVFVRKFIDIIWYGIVFDGFIDVEKLGVVVVCFLCF